MATLRIAIALPCHGKARGFRPVLGAEDLQIKIKPCRECGAKYAAFFAPENAGLFPVAGAIAGLEYSLPVAISLLGAALAVLAPVAPAKAEEVVEEAPVVEPTEALVGAAA